MNKKICMVVQNPLVKGGIAAVVNGYRGSQLEKDFDIIYVESYTDGNKLIKLFKGICAYFCFAKVLMIDKPDLIHIHSSFGISFYRKLPFVYISSLVKKPIVNHIHGSEFEKFYSNANIGKKYLVKKVYGKCAKLIALTDEWKGKFNLIVPKEKLTVIENYSMIADKVSKVECNNQVLFLGAITQMKGCYDIPRVIELVLKEIPSCKFVIAGDGDISQIKGLLKEKGIYKNVDFPGWVRGVKKDQLLRESDIFFLPSYSEGMPMSILDAMGYGLPIVSSNVGGIPNIVKQGETGYLSEPGNFECFAENILRLLLDTDLKNTMANMSYEFAENNYSLTKHIEKIESLYNEILNIEKYA